MKPKVLITIENGIIVSMFSNTDVEIVTVDYDIKDVENPVIINGPYKQDGLFKNGDSYKLVEKSEFPLSDEEIEVRDFLKEVKF